MHSFSALVVGDEDRSKFTQLGVDKRLNSVGDRIERVENVEHGWASWQSEVDAKALNASDRDKHSCKSKWFLNCDYIFVCQSIPTGEPRAKNDIGLKWSWG